METPNNEKKPVRLCKYIITRGPLSGIECNHTIKTNKEYCCEHARTVKRRNDAAAANRLRIANTITT